MSRPPVLLLIAVLALVAAAPVNDPLAERAYHLEKVRAVAGWETTRGEGLIVAVIDTGVDETHPDLRGRILRGRDLIDGDRRAQDPNGHGTLVAGIIAATANNNRGTVGVAPDVKVLPVRVLDRRGRGRSDVVAQAIRWATRWDADVINLSLADIPGQERPASELISNDVELAIREASLAGVVVVAAAGNDSLRITPYSDGVPVIVVGATDRHDVIWPKSNYDDKTLFAPGVAIPSTWRGRYAVADGTSFAAPVVAGAAALLRASGMDAEQTHHRLIVRARAIGAGLGRLDVAAALGLARRQDPITQRQARADAAASATEPAPAPTGGDNPAGPDPVIDPVDQPAVIEIPAEAAQTEPVAQPATPAPQVTEPSLSPSPTVLPGEPDETSAPPPSEVAQAEPNQQGRLPWPWIIAAALVAVDAVVLLTWLHARRRHRAGEKVP